MMIYDDYFFYITHFFILFIKIQASIKNYRFEPQIGSSIVFPPCRSTLSSVDDDLATILFKSDSGELLSMNGKLVSNNPRLIIRNPHASILILNSIELSDDGQYECRTDQTINYILHLIVINSSTIHLTVVEGSNVTLHCSEKGMWIIEESRRGGPVRKQYTAELNLNNIQRNDNRFQTIICSSFDGHEKREYIIDVMYKPTVKLVMSARRRLMCIICAHPLPHRVQWWWNTRTGRDDDIHQININQSCIAQQIIFAMEKEYYVEQMIICQAENIYGIERDSLQLKVPLTTRSLRYTMKKLFVTSSDPLMTPMISVKNESSSLCRTFLLIIIVIIFVYCLSY